MTFTEPDFFYQWYASHYRLENRKADPKAPHPASTWSSIRKLNNWKHVKAYDGVILQKTKLSHLLCTENSPGAGGEQRTTQAYYI